VACTPSMACRASVASAMAGRLCAGIGADMGKIVT
jgi:hypothetical protein